VLHEPRDFAKVEFVLYLLALVALIPVALWWMRGEVSRGASAVLLVVMLVVPFLVVRAQQIWAGTHG
jgi:hypothetical protein